MDRFRPNLPLDPFDQMEPHFGRAAWLLDPDQLDRFSPSSSSTPARDVVLVIGEPTPESLRPLLTSTHLAHSLIVVATSHAHDLQSLAPAEWTRPSVRVLRLESPLHVHDGGGSRFIHVLEWAERVARIWRAQGPNEPRSIQERTEESDQLLQSLNVPALAAKTSASSLSSAWLTPPSLNGHASPGSSPRNSFVYNDSPNGSSSSLPVPPTSFSGGSGKTKQRRPSSRLLPHADPTKRPFDALINFMPPPNDIGPKGMLKQAIMVTTLSRPFLCLPQTSRPQRSTKFDDRTLPVSRRRSGSTPGSPAGDHRRWSTLNPATGSSSSAASSPSLNSGTQTPGRPRSSYFPPIGTSGNGKDGGRRASHIVHVVPPFPDDDRHGHAALVRALEAFILNFSDAAPDERARPFVVDDARLGDVLQVPSPHRWTLADAMLAAGFDRGNGGAALLERRAWLAGADDVELRQPGTTTPQNMGGKGKAKRSAEGALPSPPPSPPQVPAVMLTPPDAPTRSGASASSHTPLTLTPPDETMSEKAAGAKRRRSTDSGNSGSANRGCLGGARRASRSESHLPEKAPTHHRKRRWWWPFGAATKA
ncbi:hypothetical protein AURDEDRAFT_146439 [Auricularia subglabra TFB-10046 SS5]|uniref:Uncharacterized protein n=1 Tax=Auricularia subglabra (strain TFB-10046 / SS5) TaxID=717982 RepID=J0DCH8_AURST|nr:hypothetical protein AURDEDRAFT_146439 [Auricularia subglabra TFB-10046 SS5]